MASRALSSPGFEEFTLNRRERSEHNNQNINQVDYPAAAKSLQSCPTLCDPVDGSPEKGQ